MALTLSSAALFTASLLVAACALFWPQLESLYLQSQSDGSPRGSGSKCPLGYEGPMPSNHPPVGSTGGAAAAAKQAVPAAAAPVEPTAQAAAAAAAAAPAASSVGHVSDRSQHVFVNGNIWTANPQFRWASSMSVDAATGEITQLSGPPSSNSCTPPGTSSSSSSPQAAAEAGAAAGSCSAAAAAAAAAPPGSTVVDLKGAFVMPAFVDPHVHLVPGGLFLSEVDLHGASSRQEVYARLAAAAAAAADGAWLVGGGWCEADWGGQMPDASWVDEAAGSHSVFLTRMDGHMALVNSAAMQAAGLDRCCGCDDGSGCESGVDTDEFGRPTGLLREEHSMALVRRLVPAPSIQQRREALHAAGRYLLSRGVTAVGDMGWALFGAARNNWEDLEQVYDVAVEQGDMPVRVSSYVPLRTWHRAAARLQAHNGGSHHPSGRLVWGGVKEFADGSLGSSTAVMWRPYADSNGSNVGMWTIEMDELESLVEGAAKAGLQVAVHAIGDRALDEVLEVFEQLEECEEDPALSTTGLEQQQQERVCVQHRIEHVQHISGPVSAAKLAVLNLHAVPNPQHLISDRAMLLPKLGWERAGAGRTHAYNTLATMGVSMGFASDWPVVPVDPLGSVYAAVFRTSPPSARQEGKGLGEGAASLSAGKSLGSGVAQPPPAPLLEPWAPEEKIALEDALQWHTHTAAKVARLDAWVGQLRPGLRADFVVLDRSPFEGLGVDGGEGFGAGMPRVVKTYMDGGCVFGCDDGDVTVAAAGSAAGASRSDAISTKAGSLNAGSSQPGGESAAAAATGAAAAMPAAGINAQVQAGSVATEETRVGV